MRKFRFYLVIFRLFIRRFAPHIVIGIAIGVLAFLARDRIVTALFVPSSERIGVLGRGTLDSLPLSVLEQLSLGITQVGPDGVPKPGVASSWEYKENGRVWTFNLNPNLRWQDGTQILSRDISYDFPDTQILYPDTQKIEFQLQDPYAAFPILVSRPAFKKGFLGNGTWEVKRISRDGQFVEDLLIENITSGQQLLFRFYQTEQNLRVAFQLGEIDSILEVSDPKNLLGWKNIKVSSTSESNRFVGVFFNTEDPFLQEKSIRQALAYATAKTFTNQKRAISPISPLSWAYNPLVKTYDYNALRARELFNQFKKGERPEKLTIATIPSLLDTAEVVAKDWREALEIEVAVQVASGVPADFQVLLATQEIPPDPDQYSMWHSTQKETNITRYNNPRVDKLLEDGRRTLVPELRKRIYLDFQRFLVEDTPVIFLYHPNSYTVSRR